LWLGRQPLPAGGSQMTTFIGRREFITLLGGAGVGWPLVARAQPAERVRRLGFLDAGGETDQLSPASRAALAPGLAALGGMEGRNLKTDHRFGCGDTDRVDLRSR